MSNEAGGASARDPRGGADLRHAPGASGAPGAGRKRSKIGNDDPRAVRTREKLIGAFNEAVRDCDPRDMSVSALTRAAGVNRTSFYGHFASPEDLAIHALSELFDVVTSADIVMRSQHTVSGAEASRQALRQIVGFVAQRRASYARLLGPGLPRGWSARSPTPSPNAPWPPWKP